jgi:uncharacterized protein with GYD domain
MAKYLVEVKYTLEGIRGVTSEGGTARVAAATASIEELGGKVEAFYFAFGENDVVVIADIPDNISAAALGLAVTAGGGAATRTTVLLTAAEMDEAAQRASNARYRPPGG